MIRHFIKAAQVAQHHFDRDVVAHGDHIEIHERADRVFRIRHRRAQLLALFRGQRAENILHDLARKIRRKICNLVGIELLGRGDQLFGLHMRDERFAHRVGNFEQNFAVAISLYEIPYSQPFFEWQRLQHIRDIRRVQAFELFLQLSQVLSVRQAVDELTPRRFMLFDLRARRLMPT